MHVEASVLLRQKFPPSESGEAPETGTGYMIRILGVLYLLEVDLAHRSKAKSNTHFLVYLSGWSLAPLTVRGKG